MTWSRHVVSAGMVAGILCISGDVGALTSESFQYAEEQIGYYSIAPMAMAPDGGGHALLEYSNPALGGVLTGRAGHCHTTAVYLPQGARLRRLEIWYNSVTSDFSEISLHEIDLEDGTVEPLVLADLLSPPEIRQMDTFEIGGNRKIDNHVKSYPFEVCLDGGARFYGARITYGYRRAGD
jgi:hypothetical protein